MMGESKKRGFLARILGELRFSGKGKRLVEQLGGFSVENEPAKWNGLERSASRVGRGRIDKKGFGR